MTDRPLPRKLEELIEEYNRIREQWETLGPDEASRRLDNLVAVDSDGVHWRISRITGQWESAGYDGQWHEADPYEFADHEEVSLDDWSSPAGPGDWGDPLPQGDLPIDDIYSDNQGVTEDWSSMIPGGPGNVIPGGAAAGYGQEGYDGWEVPQSWGQPAAPGQPGGAGTWGAEPTGWDNPPEPKKEGIVGKLAGGVGGAVAAVRRLPLAAQIGAGLLIVALVAYLVVGGGGRKCPMVDDLEIVDAAGQPVDELSITDRATHCVLGVPLVYPDTGGGNYLDYGDIVTVVNFAASMGKLYEANGGEYIGEAPEGLSAISNGDVSWERSIITAHSIGVIEGNTLSTSPVTRNQVITALGRLHYGIGGRDIPASEEGEATQLGVGGTEEARGWLWAFVKDGVLTAPVIFGNEAAVDADVTRYNLDDPALRGEVYRLLAAVYEAGGKVEYDTYQDFFAALQAEVGGVDGEAAATGEPAGGDETPQTPQEELGDLPTGDQIRGAVNALNSGDPTTLLGIISRPGNANRQALEIARFQGYKQAGIAARAAGEATTNDEGAVVVTLEFVDSATDAVLGRKVAVMVKDAGYWQWRNWPLPEPLENE